MNLAVYNEINPTAAAALRELINTGAIAPGVVDTRSIKEVSAHDYRNFTQWHFFAGGGLWSVAARAAGWPDARPLGTASCPCQPFSQAGEGLGVDDPRHLWPDLYRIIRTARDAGFGPSVWMGEQVAGKAGYDWFHGVRADLARETIHARTVDIPACSVDAPHERNRLYWVAVADAEGERSGGNESVGRSSGRALDGRIDASSTVAQPDSGRQAGRGVSGSGEGSGADRERPHGQSGRSDGGCGVVDAASIGRGEGGTDAEFRGWRAAATESDVREPVQHSGVGHLDHTERAGRQGLGRYESDAARWRKPYRPVAAPNGSYWCDGEWITCHDGKARRAKSTIPMLVNGMAGRSHLWSLVGNSIVPVLATEVVRAFLDAEADHAAPVLIAPPPY